MPPPTITSPTAPPVTAQDSRRRISACGPLTGRSCASLLARSAAADFRNATVPVAEVRSVSFQLAPRPGPVNKREARSTFSRADAAAGDPPSAAHEAHTTRAPVRPGDANTAGPLAVHETKRAKFSEERRQEPGVRSQKLADATGATPFVYLQEQFRAAHGAGWQRRIDRLGLTREKLVLGILAGLDRQRKVGNTDEAVSAAVAAAVGAELSGFVRIIAVKQGRLIVTVPHPALNFPVRSKLEAARRAKRLPTIKAITVRVGEGNDESSDARRAHSLRRLVLPPSNRAKSPIKQG
jgi:hypothetical protein